MRLGLGVLSIFLLLMGISLHWGASKDSPAWIPALIQRLQLPNWRASPLGMTQDTFKAPEPSAPSFSFPVTVLSSKPHSVSSKAQSQNVKPKKPQPSPRANSKQTLVNRFQNIHSGKPWRSFQNRPMPQQYPGNPLNDSISFTKPKDSPSLPMVPGVALASTHPSRPNNRQGSGNAPVQSHKKSIYDFIKEMWDNPSQEMVMAFFKAYQLGEIDEITFFSIIKQWLKSEDNQKRKWGLWLIEMDLSMTGFLTVWSVSQESPEIEPWDQWLTQTFGSNLSGLTAVVRAASIKDDLLLSQWTLRLVQNQLPKLLSELDSVEPASSRTRGWARQTATKKSHWSLAFFRALQKWKNQTHSEEIKLQIQNILSELQPHFLAQNP